MSSIQLAARRPTSNVYTVYHSRFAPSMLSADPARNFLVNKDTVKLRYGSSIQQFTRISKSSVRLSTSALKYQQCTPVCLFGGKGKPKDNNEASPWDSLGKAMGSLKKEQSLEDVLRQQMEKQEFYSDGGSGGDRPSGGGGGDGSGGSEDESVSGILDELLQVILATLGFIFLYVYIIEGEEITVLAKDIIKFLFGGQKSFRLRRTMYQWGKFYQRLTRKKEFQHDWLERAIINTPTWWDSPAKYRRILRSYDGSRAYQ